MAKKEEAPTYRGKPILIEGIGKQLPKDQQQRIIATVLAVLLDNEKGSELSCIAGILSIRVKKWIILIKNFYSDDNVLDVTLCFERFTNDPLAFSKPGVIEEVVTIRIARKIK